MQRRTFLTLGATLLTGSAVAGWTLGRGSSGPLLLSARDDVRGGHHVVGYRLDGSRAFSCPGAEVTKRLTPQDSAPEIPIADGPHCQTTCSGATPAARTNPSPWASPA